MTRMEWLAEADYIEQEAQKLSRGESWHAGTLGQFREYCEMQAQHAERDGYSQIAADIRESAKRAWGWS